MFSKKELYVLWNLQKIEDRNEKRKGEIGFVRDKFIEAVKKKYIKEEMLDILYYYCVVDDDKEYLENENMKILTKFSHYDIINCLGAEITEYEDDLIKSLGKGVLNDYLGNLGLITLWYIYAGKRKDMYIEDVTEELKEILEYELSPMISIFEPNKITDIVTHYYNKVDELFNYDITPKNIVKSMKDINLEMLENLVKLVNDNNENDWYMEVDYKGKKLKAEVISFDSDDTLYINVINKQLYNLVKSIPGPCDTKDIYLKVKDQNGKYNGDWFYGQLDYYESDYSFTIKIRNIIDTFVREHLNNDIEVFHLVLKHRQTLDNIMTKEEWKSKGCIVEDRYTIIIPLDLKIKLNPTNKK